MENTKALIAGNMAEKFSYSHEVCGEKFYRGSVSVRRASGTEDIIPVVVSEFLFDTDMDYSGKFISITGEFRSRNVRNGSKTSLDLFVFASGLEEAAEEVACNSIELKGYVCRKPVYRKTPLGREICDLMVAVNGSFGRDYYIPCICWGRNARYAGEIAIGSEIQLFGRIQSREYTKILDDGSIVRRVICEVSANKIID